MFFKVILLAVEQSYEWTKNMDVITYAYMYHNHC